MSRFRSLKAHFQFSVLLYWISFSLVDFFLVCPVLALPGAEVEVIADGEVIRIHGLSIPCVGCRVVRDNYCEIPSRNMLIACDQLVEYLLLGQGQGERQATETPEVQVKPEGYINPDELVRYLLVSDAGEPVAIASLQLLLKSEQGRAAVIRQAQALIARRSQELLTVLIRLGATEDVLASFWKVPTVAASVLPALTNSHSNEQSLRAIVAALSSKLTFDDLISELSLIDQAADLEQLNNWKRSLRQLPAVSGHKADWIKNLMQLELIIFNCRQILAFADLNQQCRGNLVETSSITRFRERLYLQRVVALLSPANVTPNEILTALATTNYRDYRTPQAHELILMALEKIAADPRSSGTAMKHPSVRVMLQTFAETDRAISKLLQSILFHQESSSRLVLTNGGRSMLSWVAFVVLILAVSLLGRKRTTTAANEDEVESTLSHDERMQLRELSRYFGLPVWTSEEKLNKEYRRRAKTLHPDTLGSTVGSAALLVDHAGEEFAILNEKHRIFKALLAKQNSRISPLFRKPGSFSSSSA